MEIREWLRFLPQEWDSDMSALSVRVNETEDRLRVWKDEQQKLAKKKRLAANQARKGKRVVAEIIGRAVLDALKSGSLTQKELSAIVDPYVRTARDREQLGLCP